MFLRKTYRLLLSSQPCTISHCASSDISCEVSRSSIVRSGANARHVRHGLPIPISSDPTYARDVSRSVSRCAIRTASGTAEKYLLLFEGKMPRFQILRNSIVLIRICSAHHLSEQKICLQKIVWRALQSFRLAEVFYKCR